MPPNRSGEPPTMDELRAAVAAIVGLEPGAIPDDANLVLLGVDSLGMMRLINLWRRTGVRVSARDLAVEPTLAAWQRHIEAARAQLAGNPTRSRPDAKTSGN
jgi:aryl carrier-like protein